MRVAFLSSILALATFAYVSDQQAQTIDQQRAEIVACAQCWMNRQPPVIVDVRPPCEVEIRDQ